ncbi:MAG TPA: FtsX-like permease family protein, partial [Blastocatellia bacterium]|nr:FtsX-like permease family protein [Blastocatellia bacterium]
MALLLRKRHHLQEGVPDDVNIRNQAELLQTMSDISNTFTILLGGIAAISLLVGGIGIMNIMLVTVTERTREIGIRKSLGARRKDILAQFLVESTTLSLIGGLIGLSVAYGISVILVKFTPIPAELPLWAAALAIGVSSGVGLIFGIYPAWKAAKLDPIVALRAE